MFYSRLSYKVLVDIDRDVKRQVNEEKCWMWQDSSVYNGHCALYSQCLCILFIDIHIITMMKTNTFEIRKKKSSFFVKRRVFPLIVTAVHGA